MITYEFLQQYWWFLVSLLGGLLAFLLFVQGGQSMIFSLSKTEEEKRLLVNVLGRKWEFTFTTLVTFGGAFFASFPLFYSTSFGGAYFVWMAILLGFVLQAVAYEFQNKAGNLFGVKTYRTFLFVNGLLATVLIGAAIATFFTGSDFYVNKTNLTNLDDGFMPVISAWGSGWHGLDAALPVGNGTLLACLRNLSLGIAVFFLARTLATLYFVNRVSGQPALEARFKKTLWVNAVPFVGFFLVFVIWTLLSKGYNVNEQGIVELLQYKYFFNLIEMPVVLILFLLGVVAVLYGIIATLFCDQFKKGIWFSGIGTVVTVLSLLLIAGYNHTAFYPSSTDLQSSLTIYNASSSLYTLKAMSWVSLLIPFVLAYIVYAWWSLEKKPATLKDIFDDGHAY
ncbi:MAG: cytochrome d ubiquinol oxidase subunit II [Bacteroidales bacterium]|jgi:cytochrome d ubiquinol oxidase subunit II|nr:cytochrome d ubiquinol oxidase subunit II [Bacteroidales bacterium]